MGFRTEQELKETYAKTLRSQGHGVSIDVPVGEEGALIDILTDSEIITCTLELTEQTAVAVKSQLDFYGRFCPNWKKVVAVERIATPEVVERLSQSGIKLVTVMSPDPTERDASQQLGGDKGSSENSQLQPRFTYSVAHDYKSFEGGKGSLAALYVLAFVVLMGLAGLVVSLQNSPPESQQSAGNILYGAETFALVKSYL